MFIHHYINWQNDRVSRDGNLLYRLPEMNIADIPAALYREAGISYPKFFKMDMLSRCAFAAAELLQLPTLTDAEKETVATIVSTHSGCLDVDKKFEQSRREIASPALFVYTLPNIMLGEICIRHGFKGAQMCLVDEQGDADLLSFYAEDLMQQRQASAVLCGHAEATENNINVNLLWVSREESGLPFNSKNMAGILAAGQNMGL